jgi:protein phosphatase
VTAVAQPRSALDAAGLSDPGRRREVNEDAFHVDEAGGIFVVADGIASLPAGATAAHVVVEVLPRLVRQRVAPAIAIGVEPGKVALRDAVVDLGTQLRERAAGKVGISGMGATVVAAVVAGELVLVASMGDSRVYRLRSGALERLTEDHSVVGILLRRGELTAEQAATHPSRGLLSRYVGMAGLVYPDVRAVDVIPGDRLLLCTDGLSGQVCDDDLREALAAQRSPADVCHALVDLANDRGGADNVTALVIDVRLPRPTEGHGT